MSFPPTASGTHLNRISAEDLTEAGMEIGDHRVHRLGNCLLTQKQLLSLYKNKQITDKELEDASVEPTSMRSAANKRSLTVNELWEMREKRRIEKLRAINEDQSWITDEVRAIGEKHGFTIDELRAIRARHIDKNGVINGNPICIQNPQILEQRRAHKQYDFPLLNQLVGMMVIESEPDIILPESHFNLDAIYWERRKAKFSRLEPKEQERRQFGAFFDYMQDQCLHGDSSKAIRAVTDAHSYLSRRRKWAPLPNPRPKRKPVPDEPGTTTDV